MENFYDIIDKIDVNRLLSDLNAGDIKFKKNLVIPKDKKYTIDVDGKTINVNIKIGPGFKGNSNRMIAHPLYYIDCNDVTELNELPTAEKKDSEFVIRRLGVLVGISYLIHDENVLREIYHLAPKKKDGNLHKNRVVRIASDAVIEVAGGFEIGEKTIARLFAKADGEDTLTIKFDRTGATMDVLELMREDYVSFSWEMLGLDKYLI